MKISTRMLLMVALAFAGMCAISAVGIRNAAQDGEVIRAMHDVRMRQVRLLLELKAFDMEYAQISYAVAAAGQLPADQQAAELRGYLEALNGMLGIGRKMIAEFEGMPLPEDAKTAWQRFKGVRERWRALDKEILADLKEAVPSPSPAAFSALYRKAVEGNRARKADSQAMFADIEEIIQKTFAAADQEAAKAEAGTRGAIQAQLSVLVLALLLLAAAYWRIRRRVLLPLARASRSVQAIAQNLDLTVRTGQTGKDELARFLLAFDGMMGRFHAAFSAIREQMNGVQQSVDGLGAASQSVAQSSAEQSGATAAMAASVEKMSETVQGLSERADSAQQEVVQMGEATAQGSAIIGRMGEEMENIAAAVGEASAAIAELGQKSAQISGVVEVIREVAEQTNLLALNAAIEAARAGEAGRGFAVVADEVRKLAERTAQSTADITRIVGEIQSATQAAVGDMDAVVAQVQNGQALERDASGRIDSIREVAGKVAQAVLEIAAALQQQGEAGHDIAAHVETAAQTIDENAAAAATVADNTARLEALARDVHATVGEFRI